MQASANKRTLREWRAYRNFDKQTAAARMSVHPSTYANWESHPESIRVKNIPQIAGAFECQPDEIIFFEENPSFKLGVVLDDSGESRTIGNA